MKKSASPRKVAVLGGTGALGSSLAARLAAAGHDVTIGSRDAGRAAEAGKAIGAKGATYADATAASDIVILTVPFASQEDTLAQIKAAAQGKIVVDATVPLVPPKVMRVQLPAEGSAAVKAQGLLGEGVQVVSAFQNVGARHLESDGHAIDCDVLVTGDSAEARGQVVKLIQDIGMRGLHAGPLANAAAAEALTSLLIFMNKTYKTDRAGIVITGVEVTE